MIAWPIVLLMVIAAFVIGCGVGSVTRQKMMNGEWS